MFFTPVYLAAATSFHFHPEDKHEPYRPTRKFFDHFLHRKRSSIVNDTPLGDSKRLTLPRGKPDGLPYASQLSIMAEQGSVEDREICICRFEDRAGKVHMNQLCLSDLLRQQGCLLTYTISSLTLLPPHPKLYAK